jgi:hypothetical protein
MLMFVTFYFACDDESFCLAFLSITITFYTLHDVPLFLYGVNAQCSCIKQSMYTYKVWGLIFPYLLKN